MGLGDARRRRAIRSHAEAGGAVACAGTGAAGMRPQAPGLALGQLAKSGERGGD